MLRPPLAAPLRAVLPLLLTTLLSAQDPAIAQEPTAQEPAAEAPVATAQTLPESAQAAQQLDLDALGSRLRPLTKEELAGELEAWLSRLQDKAFEIRDAELAALTAEDDAAIASAEDRAVTLRSERDALIRRVELVIDALEAKTGDVASARAYVDALVVAPSLTGLRAAWVTFRTWITNPEGGLLWAKNIGVFLAILIAFAILAWVAGRLIDHAMRTMRRSSDLLRTFLVSTTRKVIILIGVVMALGQIGIDIAPMVAAIGGAAFIVGFALQGTLSNFASGVMIMLYQPFEIGDVISAVGIIGTVDAMNLVSTTIKTGDNQHIIVPNSKIWGDVITNINAAATRRVDMAFGIGYGDDIGKARDILRRIVTSHPLVLADPAPQIDLNQLGESSMNFVVRPWTKTGDYWTVYYEVTRTVKEQFDANGITMPFPQREIRILGDPSPVPQPPGAVQA